MSSANGTEAAGSEPKVMPVVTPPTCNLPTVNAKAAFAAKRYPAAISQFRKVVDIPFTDSDGVKQRAQLGLKQAKEKLMEQSNAFIKEGKAALEIKDYKKAITAFSKALEISKENGDALSYRDKAQRELFTEMKNLYSESVIEESLGNIDSSKKKWKIILENSFPKDEYYQKAKTKLGKYEK